MDDSYWVQHQLILPFFSTGKLCSKKFNIERNTGGAGGIVHMAPIYMEIKDNSIYIRGTTPKKLQSPGVLTLSKYWIGGTPPKKVLSTPGY